jgi:DNA-binding transcriptional MerR regulator/mannose-6-phosphate isomerase-like protein (cupin superfamily)
MSEQGPPQVPTVRTVLYRIGDAAHVLGISAATLRLWERQGLIRPARSAGGNRWYTEDDIVLLRKIQHLRRVEHLAPRASARLLRHADSASTPAPPAASGTAAATVNVGARLRAERQRAGLTLRAVADQVTMSVSFLSAVERGVTGLSIARLHALVKLYGLTVQDLISDSRTEGRLVRANNRPQLPTSNDGIRIEQLAIGRQEMEPHLFVIEPGAGSDGSYDHAGEELIFLMRGALEVWLDEREHYVMSSGDCLYFPSTLPHRWHNPGPEQTELIWVNTPPTF